MIETKRLQIRAFTREDAKAFSDYRNKPEVYEYQSWSHYPLSKARARIAYCLAHPFQGQKGNYQLAVVLKDTNTLIGDYFIEVHSINTVIVGYTLDSQYWSLGYGSESLQAILSYLKEEYYFKVALCYVYKNNKRSIRLLENNGFIQFEYSVYMGDVGYKKLL
jgi:RimJ/RimL family protein N-acetyltransferase